MSQFGGGFEPKRSEGLAQQLRSLARRAPTLTKDYSKKYAKGLLGRDLSEKEALIVAVGSVLLLLAGITAILVAGTGSKQIALREEFNRFELARVDGETNKLYFENPTQIAGELSQIDPAVDSALFDRTDRTLVIRDLSALENCSTSEETSCGEAINVRLRLIAVKEGFRDALRSFSAVEGTWLSVGGRKIISDETKIPHELKCSPDEICIIFQGFSEIGR
ncbi:MAG: hypothetical protein KDD66_04365 [Bdellovibrionales bacterium]|nr:hypothetical protein [Bdellovibrionales bacterium]